MNFKSIAAFAVILLPLFSCNRSDSDDAKMVKNHLYQKPVQVVSTADSTFKDQQVLPPQPPIITGEKNKSSSTPTPVAVDYDKKIIKNATLSAEVKDFKQYSRQLRELAKRYGSYIAAEEQFSSPERIEDKITIKVPVAQFDDAINEICNLESAIKNKSISSEDVSSEVVDTRSRIETKKLTMEKYKKLMDEAKNVNDVMSVQSTINNMQEELESAGARVNYLQHSAAFSTIVLNFYQVLKETKSAEESSTFSGKALQAMSYGWTFIKELVLVLLGIWPLLLLSIAAWYWYRVNLVSKRKEKP